VNYVGIDLHKNYIVTCVMDQDRKIIGRRTLACSQVRDIRADFESLRPFRAVVEATASYEWLLEWIEPTAEKVVLAHPGKLRVSAESVKKTDRLDAQVLAEFLARDMVPTAHRPTGRQREHRTLVRHRQFLQGRLTAIKNKIRRFAADSNADRKDLFTPAGLEALAGLELREADRFVLGQLWDEWEHHKGQLRAIKVRLEEFAKQAPTAEAEARAVLRTIPGVGAVTVDVIVS
jgi:transposase